MENKNNLIPRRDLFKDKETFIKQVLFSSTNIIRDNEFKSIGITNKNLMFFLNLITDNLSSISMIGCRNLNNSLLGQINNVIEYYKDINLQFSSKDKNPKIPKYKIDYIKFSLTNNKFISDDQRKKYSQFMNESDDLKFIENLKLIYISLKENKYFEQISDDLYELIMDSESSDDKNNMIYDLSNEYFSLLMDYVGISIYEIKRIIRDTYREFFKYNNQNIFLNMFSLFAKQYNIEEEYSVFIKMDRDFDANLLMSLKQSGNDNYKLYSKTGLIKVLNEMNINNKKQLNDFTSKISSENDNNCYLSAKITSKDKWQAIKKFKQKIIQPFIGSMLYSGIKTNTSGKYIIIEYKDNKKFINYYNFFDDVFKPLTQDRINYSDVFKRYIIEESSNQINDIIDETVQLLPYYKNSESTLTKFTNTWFALETLFRNASDNISKSLEEYASYIVADRMLSGYIYVTAVQIKKTYKNFEKLSNNFIENIFLNFTNKNPNDCDFLNWKYNRISMIAKNYQTSFDKCHNDAINLLMNAYYIRNKQFHGNKNSQMENISGFIYDIVNDTIAFYIDYIDVYRNEEKNLYSLFNFIQNIKKIKTILINEKSSELDKILIIFDSVRKI